METGPSLELLESTHVFPGLFQIKAIGSRQDNFEGRVLEVVRSELGVETVIQHSVRETSGGRYIALTLDVSVQSAEQVRSLYAGIHRLTGLRFLL
ncbi:MAG: hypothetical protein NVSMB9_28350 [Isosphaeraceae bacterium]